MGKSYYLWRKIYVYLFIVFIISLTMTFLFWTSSCQKTQKNADNVELDTTILKENNEIKISSLRIESDLGFYSSKMSIVPGLPLRPVLKGDNIPNNILYQWIAQSGRFLKWKQDQNIEILGNDVRNAGEIIYWIPDEDFENDDNPGFYITLNIIDRSDDKILGDTNILIKTDGEFFYIDGKEKEIEKYRTENIPDDIGNNGKTLNDFSVLVNGGYLSIFDEENQIDLQRLLGEPIYENIEVLGEGADTFAGSFTKTMQYEGLELELFSAVEKAESFWITGIKITSGIYVTKRNIRVGSTLEELKEEYPSAKMVLDGRTDENNSAYEFSMENDLTFIHFEVNDGIIVQIYLFYIMP
jgi:hypothetical protein